MHGNLRQYIEYIYIFIFFRKVYSHVCAIEKCVQSLLRVDVSGFFVYFYHKATYTHSPSGDGAIYMNNVNCRGTELSLF